MSNNCENCGASSKLNSGKVECGYCGSELVKPVIEKKVIMSNMGKYTSLKDVKLIGNMNTITYAEDCEIIGSMNKIKKHKNTIVKGNMNDF